MLSKILRDQFLQKEVFETLYPRYSELEDEFINEYKPTITNIKNPIKDNTDKEQ